MLCSENCQIYCWFSHLLTSTLFRQRSGCLHLCRSCLAAALPLFASLVAELSVVEWLVVVWLVVELLVSELSVPGLLSEVDSGPRSTG